MKIASRLAELKKKHMQLSDEIESLQRSPGSDSLQIKKLKKQKLRLKEQMTKLLDQTPAKEISANQTHDSEAEVIRSKDGGHNPDAPIDLAA